MIPQDPIMLYSYINLKLRDQYPSLEEFCKSEGLDLGAVVEKLGAAGFEYLREINQFR